MANIDLGSILRLVENQSKALAEKLFNQYTHQAVSDVRDFFAKIHAQSQALGRRACPW